MKKKNSQGKAAGDGTQLRASGMPYALAGVVFLLFTMSRRVASFWSYLWPALLALLAFRIGKRIFRGVPVEVKETPPSTGDAQCDQLLQEARKELAAIRKTDEGIADEAVSQCIREIDQTCGQILQKLEEQPELYDRLRTFLRYYLPTTRKILNNRAMIEQRGNMDEKNAKAICERTDRLLPQINSAFQKQLTALEEHNYLDVAVEMDVLEGMMKGDGFSMDETPAQGKTPDND